MSALDARAAVLGVKPTVLARNMIRLGLRGGNDVAAAGAMDRLEAAVADVRALVG